MGDVDENVQGHIRCVYVIVLVPRFTKQESLGHVTKHSHHSTLHCNTTSATQSVKVEHGGLKLIENHTLQKICHLFAEKVAVFEDTPPSLPLNESFRDIFENFFFVFSADVLHIFPKKLFQSCVYQSLVLFPETLWVKQTIRKFGPAVSIFSSNT